MSVYCQQLIDGIAVDAEFVIQPHFDGQTDLELLVLKAKGAEEKGWTVKWRGKTSFSAHKKRWEDNDVVRIFRIG